MLGRTRGLPADLMRDAAHRLSVMALLGGLLWILLSVLDHILVQRAQGDPTWVAFKIVDAISLAVALGSFALYFYARHTSRSPESILDLGHYFLILNALALGISWHWAPVRAEDMIAARSPAITWMGVLIVVFAALVPSTRNKILISSLIAVSMHPLGMAIAKARGAWQFDGLGDILLMHFPDYIVVAVAVVIAQVVNQLGQQVTKAREMGSYRLGELLGQGGMGQVFRATHRMLARPAAIKLIRPEMIFASAEGDTILKRFRLEADAAANLRSPHTVELYDFGVTEDQTFYFVMELLEGMTLDTLVREHGPVPPNRVIHILRQVCESLEEAHVGGLVHRDIKPANIHIGRFGLRNDFVKVLDFGLVKSVKAPTSSQEVVTEVGMTPGTPAYMAPEMALGERIDGRADIYALGCVAYYLLTGKLIFEAANMYHVIAQHLKDAPIPPSRRSGSFIPPGLEQLVLACVAKKPDDRPASAAELSRLLGEVEVEPWTEAHAAVWWQIRAANAR